MKKIVILAIICNISLAACQEKLPEKIKALIAKNQSFWKNRTILINKNNKIEYPIKKDTTINEERTNRIYLHSGDCQFEVLVDDVTMFRLMGGITKEEPGRGGLGITGGYDINQLLLTSGQHEVTVRLYPMYGNPLFGPSGGVDLQFYHFKDRDLRTKQYNEAMNGSSGIKLDQANEQWIDGKGEYGTDSYVEGHYAPKTPLPLKGLPAYEWRSTFNAEVPFDLVGWRNSVNLKKEQEDEHKDIIGEAVVNYTKIHDIIEKRDIQGYLTLVKEREELTYKTLFYRKNEEKLREDEFIKLIKNEDYEVEPLFKETFQLEYQAYGKLVMLLHKADREGIIRLRNKKNPNDTVYLDFRFQRKKKGDPLTVI